MVTLNVYAEHNQPKAFSSMLSLTIVFFTFFAAGMGTIGYLAFGDETKPIILYNMPDQDILSITAKLAYLLTIAGSYILLIQPVFKIVEATSLVRTAAGEEQSSQKYLCTTAFIRIAIVYLIVFIASLLPSIDVVLQRLPKPAGIEEHTGNTGEIPGRPRRCNQISNLKSSSYLAWTSFITIAITIPDREKVLSKHV
jgi:amino acid permease